MTIKYLAVTIDGDQRQMRDAGTEIRFRQVDAGFFCFRIFCPWSSEG
ncbi:MAG: hypothetical protein ACUVXD_01830 [Thermodesulfobacteriota bacterium]